VVEGEAMIPTSKLLDFNKNGGYYTFRVTAKDQNLPKTILALKEAVPFTDRWFDAEARIWNVKRTPQNEAALREIFTNADQAITMAEAQLTLF
jgi:hypothetical protein